MRLNFRQSVQSEPIEPALAPRPLRLFGLAALAALTLLALSAAACGSSDSSVESASPSVEIIIGGIPDQNVATLEERFGNLSQYLTDYFASETSSGSNDANQPRITFRYQPSIDYAAVVTSFAAGDIQLGWFGGLSGVQARTAQPGAQAVAHRLDDAEFMSVWIVRNDLDANTISDLQGRSLTFGSENSTSGRLMPQYFLQQDGIDIDNFFSDYSFSGSHDKTWQLVEAGTYDAGVLNINVWNAAVADGRVDADRVRVLEVTEPYYDYHWLLRSDIDETYGAGTADKIVQALLMLDENGDNPLAAGVLENFQTTEFVTTENANYDQIEAVARQLDLLR